jgi:hypothetical protein
MKRMLSIAGLALLGIALAVGVTLAVASLSSQSVGISEEPLEAGVELAVPVATAPARPRTQTVTTPARTTAATARTTAAPPPTPADDEETGADDRSGSNSGSDDDSGRGRGRGRGRGGDDD